MQRLYWKILDFIYKLIRKTFWKSYDVNEEFYCCWCLKPVYNRYIFCSKKCEIECELAEWDYRNENYN
jgi:predicted nucleotidyltransferase